MLGQTNHCLLAFPVKMALSDLLDESQKYITFFCVCVSYMLSVCVRRRGRDKVYLCVCVFSKMCSCLLVCVLQSSLACALMCICGCVCTFSCMFVLAFVFDHLAIDNK